MMPTDYLARFAHLYTAVSRSRWSAATRYRAPNMPLRLLAVLDSAAQGMLTANLIEPTPDLCDLFAGYLDQCDAGRAARQPGNAVLSPAR